MNDVVEQFEYLRDSYHDDIAAQLVTAQVLAEIKESIDDIRRDMVRHDWVVEHAGDEG